MRIFNSVILCLFFASLSNAQVTRQWVAKFESPAQFEQGNELRVTKDGDVYIAGYSNGNMLLVKYNAIGQELWSRVYIGPVLNGFDFATSMEIDSKGNILIAGFSEGIGTGRDYMIIKYTSSGDTVWSRRYTSSGTYNDGINALGIDSNDNIFVTGYSGSNSSNESGDYLTIKYDSSGKMIWNRTFDGSNQTDIAYLLGIDNSENIIIAGTSYLPNGQSKSVIFKYDQNGTPVWISGLLDTANLNEDLNSIAIDNSDNCVIAGQYGNDYLIRKLDASGMAVWKRTYNSPRNHIDHANSVDVDRLGNVYVTGSSAGTDFLPDVATLKYNSNGDLQWIRRYFLQENSTDFGTAIKVDYEGNSFITGRSNKDIITFKYDVYGNMKWFERVEPAMSHSAESEDVQIDSLGNVYSLGWEYTGDHTVPITIKYSQVVRVNLKAIIEGIYEITNERLLTRDTVTLLIRETNTPFEIVDSAKAVIDSLTFAGTFQLNNTPNGGYYIVLKHRNSLETWSKAGEEVLIAGTNYYDFTTDDSQAYGDNLKLLGKKYCIFGGDVDKDGFIDGTDNLLIDNDALIFATGYLQTDLTGNRFVDATDLAIVHNNSARFVTIIKP